MTKHTVLFLAANPLGSDRLALDEEARAIQTELERSGHRDQFELVTRWAVRPLDLLRELRKLKPTIVHFSGHGGHGGRGQVRPGKGPHRDVVGDDGVGGHGQHGLYFQGQNGRPQIVSTAALEETFGAAGSSVKLVVLNACYSEVQAEVLLTHVDCVVGIAGSIRDDAATSFAIGFYGGLAEHESVAVAYRQGCAAVSLEGLSDGERPLLKVRNCVDAEQLVLGTGSPGTSAGAAPVRFAAMAIDSSDSNWSRVDSDMFDWLVRQEPASLYLASFVGGADPLLDVTLLNTSEKPVICSAVGIEILRVMHDPIRGLLPGAAKIPRSGYYQIKIPNILSKIRDIRIQRISLNRFISPDRFHEPIDVSETVWHTLPDPIYLERGAPYRFGLLLKYYSIRMPTLARVRLCVSTDQEICRSSLIDLYKNN